jgi:four helix bundle protein
MQASQSKPSKLASFGPPRDDPVTPATPPRATFAPMTTGVRELRLWQEAVAMGGEVTRLMRQRCRRETRTFTDQVTATALAVATSIADGYGRPDPADQRDCYRRAKRFLAQLETELAVARHANLVSPETLAQLTLRLGAVSRLLGGYLSFIDRQIAVEAAADAAALGTITPVTAAAAAPPLGPAPPTT